MNDGLLPKMPVFSTLHGVFNEEVFGVLSLRSVLIVAPLFASLIVVRNSNARFFAI